MCELKKHKNQIYLVNTINNTYKLSTRISKVATYKVLFQRKTYYCGTKRPRKFQVDEIK